MARGPVATRSGSEANESVVGRGTRVRGRVHGEGSLRVQGALEGDVQVTGDLEIEEGGAVTGDVDAGALVVGGQLTGDVAAHGPITIRATARVEGNMGSAEVILEEGAAFAGRIEAEFDLPAGLGTRSGSR